MLFFFFSSQGAALAILYVTVMRYGMRSTWSAQVICSTDIGASRGERAHMPRGASWLQGSARARLDRVVVVVPLSLSLARSLS